MHEEWISGVRGLSFSSEKYILYFSTDQESSHIEQYLSKLAPDNHVT